MLVKASVLKKIKLYLTSVITVMDITTLVIILIFLHFKINLIFYLVETTIKGRVIF